MSKSILTPLAVPAHLNPENVQVRMAGTPDNPLFCLADVCQVLGLQAPHMVARGLDSDEKVQVNTRSQASGIPDEPERGNPNLWFITESGLYTVLLRSDKVVAKPIQKWVTREVLPCIRKHGCYPAPAVVPEMPRPWSLSRRAHTVNPGQASLGFCQAATTMPFPD